MIQIIGLNFQEPHLQKNLDAISDNVWSFRTYGKSYSIESIFLKGMEISFSLIAQDHPNTFRLLADQLGKPSITLQFLLTRAYTANGKEYADTAVDYLIESPARFNIGYISDPSWAARELIVAITPFCSKPYLDKLENSLLNYYPPYERSIRGYQDRSFGYAQFKLLSGINIHARSEKVIRRLQEHQRKFIEEGVNEAPCPTEFRSVPPPISKTRVRKMKDEHWLKAISKYTNEHSTFSRKGKISGGVHQLGDMLTTEVKNNPSRFIELFFKFPEQTHEHYFGAVLRGLFDAKLDADTVYKLCKRCHELPDRPCGQTISEFVEKMSSLPDLPEALFDALIWYALEDPNPSPNKPNVTTQGKDVNGPESILLNGINSVRGNAAEAIASLIFSDVGRFDYFRPTIQRLIEDPNAAVKSCVAKILIAVLNHDRDTAVNLFVNLCQNEDGLLGTQYIERFLRYTTTTHYKALKPILENMLQSSMVDVIVVGARQICLAALSIDDASSMAQVCIGGSEAYQLGAAQVFSANLRNLNHSEICTHALTQLFNSPYEKVRVEASSCFRQLQNDELGRFVGLVEIFAESEAFAENYQTLLDVLNNTTAQLSEITISVCSRVVDHTLNNSQSSMGWHPDTISTLIVRVYAQHERNQEIQSQALDVIDHLVGLRVYGVDQALSAYDR